MSCKRRLQKTISAKTRVRRQGTILRENTFVNIYIDTTKMFIIQTNQSTTYTPTINFYLVSNPTYFDTLKC
jgi:hypothetical protein